MSANAIKRILNKDLKEIQKMNLDKLGIHIIFNEENMLNAKAIIIGPKDTPFENGILFFNIAFPTNYPFSPPSVKYYSSSRTRIHPNLYVGRSHDNFLGKVCLSIINTWSGPKWTTIMHIGSIMISIQSLLCQNPLHNEPGFENEKGKRNDLYNKIVQYDTFVNLINKNCFKIPEDYKDFQGIISDHLTKEKQNIIDKATELEKNNPKTEKVNLNIYNLNMIIDYPRLKIILNKNLSTI